MKYQPSLIILLFIFFTSINYAQGEYQVELLDEETLEPISYATVRFGGTNRGIVADYYGNFRLPYTFSEDYEILLITALGYTPLEIDIKSLLKNEINTFKMVTQVEALETVVLNSSSKRDKVKSLNHLLKQSKKLSAYDIVKKAVNAIPLNLNNLSHSYVGYYRDYQVVDNTYNNLNEGILEQFDAGIHSNKIKDSTNQSVFYSFKQNTDFKIDSLYLQTYDGVNKFVENAQILGYGGNELSILNTHNPIRNFNKQTFSFVYQLNKEFLELHGFHKGDIIYEGNEPIIIIQFNDKINRENTLFTGLNRNPNRNSKIYKQFKVNGYIKIALSDFSIYEFSYSIFDKNELNAMFNVNIAYRKQNNKMYLNYITFNNRFVVTEKNVFWDSDIIYNKQDKFFEVTLNSDINTSTVKKRNFRVRYNGHRILIKSVGVVDRRTIKVNINDFNGSLENLSPEDMKDLSFIIKEIKDSRGREIYQPELITGYQFREFFVQEVFENKKLEDHLKYIEKEQPLYVAPVNDIGINKGYIINSPLKSTRTN